MRTSYDGYQSGGEKLNGAINRLSASLNPALWLDPFHLRARESSVLVLSENKRGRRPSQSPASSQLVAPFEKGGQVRLASIFPELFGCKRFSPSSTDLD